MLNLNYDNKFDVLYIAFGSEEYRKNSLADEEYDGLVVMRDETTDIITGLIVFGFKEKYIKNKIPVFPSDVKINIEKDIVPFVSL